MDPYREVIINLDDLMFKDKIEEPTFHPEMLHFAGLRSE
jgi:hypothetical protein